MSNLNKQVLKLDNSVLAHGAAATFYPFMNQVSASRLAMTTNQIAQPPVLVRSEPSFVQTGFESQLANHCAGERAPCNMNIISVIPRYDIEHMNTNIKSNPEVYVIYQNLDYDGPGVLYGLLEIKSYTKTHDAFGAPLHLSPKLPPLQANTFIPKGQLITHSTNITYHLTGEPMYSQGINANVVYLSDEASIEDGIRVSQSFVNRCGMTRYTKFTLTCGPKYVPLNLYGGSDIEDYLVMPDIGDYVREDGILFATRKFDPYLAAVNLTHTALSEFNELSDEPVYAKPGSKVVDVKVISSKTQNPHQSTPYKLGEQFNTYADLASRSYENIISVYNMLYKEHKHNLHIDPQFQNKTVMAYADKPNEPSRNYNRNRPDKIRRTFRGQDLDEFHVEVMLETPFEIGLAAKITGLAGDKGVLCTITADEDMPTDEFGNIADVVIFPRGPIARLNTGQITEHYIGAHTRDTSRDIRKWYQEGMSKEDICKFLIDYYSIIAPPMALLAKLSKKDKIAHVDEVLRRGIILEIPSDNTWANPSIYPKLEKFKPLQVGKVQFTNTRGVKEWTKLDCIIGVKYWLILEKADSKPMAVAGSKRQLHGFISGTGKSGKVLTPTNEKAARSNGEAETRSISSSIGSYALAKQLDYSVNPKAEKEVMKAIWNNDKPSNIKYLIDRNELPLGGGRPISFINGLYKCRGVEYTVHIDQK